VKVFLKISYKPSYFCLGKASLSGKSGRDVVGLSSTRSLGIDGSQFTTSNSLW
jgi:hypothetical protein